MSLLVVSLGVAVGIVTSLGQAHLDRPFAALVNSAGPWLIAPFLIGALCQRIRGAAFAGLAACILQLVAYYATAHVRGYAAGGAIVVFWLLCGLIGGPVFGAAGFLWRRGAVRVRGLGGTALGAAFLAEGIWVYWHSLHYDSTALLWIGIALLLLVLFARLPIEFRWLPVTFTAAAVGEIILAAAYTQSIG